MGRPDSTCTVRPAWPFLRPCSAWQPPAKGACSLAEPQNCAKAPAHKGPYRIVRLLSWPISVGMEPEMLLCWTRLPSHATCTLPALPNAMHAKQPAARGGCSLTEPQNCAKAPAERKGLYRVESLLSCPIFAGSTPEMRLLLTHLPAHALLTPPAVSKAMLCIATSSKMRLLP